MRSVGLKRWVGLLDRRIDLPSLADIQTGGWLRVKMISFAAKVHNGEPLHFLRMVGDAVSVANARPMCRIRAEDSVGGLRCEGYGCDQEPVSL